LDLVRWPRARRPVLVVGHQPTLGETIAHLLQLQEGECPVPKGSVWWLRTRERDGLHQTVIVAVQSPETL
jgi:phosphohistidine phosphatase